MRIVKDFVVNYSYTIVFVILCYLVALAWIFS